MLKRFKTKRQAISAIYDAPLLNGCRSLRFNVATTSRKVYYAEEFWHYSSDLAIVDCIGQDGFTNQSFVTLSLLTLESLTRIYNHVYGESIPNKSLTLHQP